MFNSIGKYIDFHSNCLHKIFAKLKPDLLSVKIVLKYYFLQDEEKSPVTAASAKDYEETFENSIVINPRANRDYRIESERTSEIIPSVTATRKPHQAKLEDLFLSVKTTKHYHNHRLPIILKTWFQLAKQQVR